MTQPFQCPICECVLTKNADAPTPPAATNGRRKAKYNFDVMEVGDSLTIPLTQASVASRLASWRMAKSRPERASRLFTTRRVDANTTTIWRIK